MNESILTFGETLNKFMKAKKTTSNKLCEKMNIKSSTEVVRILNDSCSFEKIESFFNAFKQINPLNLVQSELNQFIEALKVNKSGKDLYEAHREMLYFVNDKSNTKHFTCENTFGNIPNSIQTLDDLFESYSNYKSVKIFAVNCVFDGVAKALSLILENNTSDILVEQYIQYGQNISTDTRQFVTILPILNYDRYHCYQTYLTSYNGNETLNCLNNMMFVLKVSKSGEHLTDIISIYEESKFSLLFNQSGTEMYNFYINVFENMSLQHNQIKQNPQNNGNANKSIIEIEESFLRLELTYSQLIIKPHFCFYAVSEKRLEKLIKDNIVSDREVKILTDLHKQRFENYKKKSREHIGIYSKQGTLKFLETGIFSDHPPIMRPFNKDEAKEALREIIKISEESPSNKIYLLKNDIIYNAYQYLIYNKQILYFCKGHTDYVNTNFNYIVNSNQIVDIFCDFIISELIPNHCHTADESLDILRSFVE